MCKADDLRAALPRLVNDLSQGVTDAVGCMLAARAQAEKDLENAAGAGSVEQRIRIVAWMKGIDDALRCLRVARETNDTLRKQIDRVAVEVNTVAAERV